MSAEKHSIIYIPDEQEYGELVTRGAYASLVRYSSGGVMYEVMMLNEDFDIVQDIVLEIEEEY
jgi:hypothetical protein